MDEIKKPEQPVEPLSDKERNQLQTLLIQRRCESRGATTQEERNKCGFEWIDTLADNLDQLDLSFVAEYRRAKAAGNEQELDAFLDKTEKTLEDLNRKNG